MAEITQPTRFQLGDSRVSTSTVLTTGSNWTVRPWLVCELLAERAGPAIDEAVLRYDVGDFTVREVSAHAVDEAGNPIVAESLVTPLELNEHYCKVEITDGDGAVVKTWYGVIELTEDQLALTGLDLESGRQSMRAFGLARLLEQTTIATSRVLDSTGNAPFTIGRGLTFNGDNFGAYPVRGNRSFIQTQGTNDVYIFTHEPRDQDLWDGSSALKYLLAFHAPQNGDGTTAGNWQLNIASENILDWYDLTVPTERRTLKQVIDAIVDRRRLLGYRVYGEEPESGDTLDVTLEVFTFAETAIVLPERGKTLGANANPITLDYQGSPLVTHSRLTTSEVHAADVVVAEGEYVTSTFTARYTDLDEGWTSEQETDYRDGDGGGADEVANTAARTTDAVADVFSRFLIADDWDQEVENAAATKYFVTVDYEFIDLVIADGDIAELFLASNQSPGQWWFKGKRFLHRLPLADENSQEFRRPFVLFQEPAATTKYRYAHVAQVGESGMRAFNCSLYLLDDALGFRVVVNIPGGQQLIAGQDAWSTAAATPPHLDPDKPENKAVEYDEMLLTAAVEWDERVRYEHKVNEDLAAGKHQRVRRIFVPDARLDFEIPGCVTDVDQDGTLIESTGVILRDDRKRLKEIAVAAGQWYGTARQTIEVAYQDITPHVSLGELVTESDGNTINTVITSVTYNLARGTTSIATSYVEADFA